MNQKIRELMRKIDTAKTTIQRLSLLEELGPNKISVETDSQGNFKGIINFKTNNYGRYSKMV